MSSGPKLKSIRQIKERAAVIRQSSKISIPRSLDLAAREHGFLDFENARQTIGDEKAALKAAAPIVDHARLPKERSPEVPVE